MPAEFPDPPRPPKDDYEREAFYPPHLARGMTCLKNIVDPKGRTHWCTRLRHNKGPHVEATPFKGVKARWGTTRRGHGQWNGSPDNLRRRAIHRRLGGSD